MTRLDYTTMTPMDEALKYLKSREEGEYFISREICDKYGVDKSTSGEKIEGCDKVKRGGEGGGCTHAKPGATRPPNAH